jgi:hypothetical protein
MLMPAFHRFPQEAAIIGRIIVGIGELEFILARCVGEALQDETTALRTIFRLGSTSARFDAAECLAASKYRAAKLATEFAETVRAVRNCYKIRNQYAHSHWADHPRFGLFFTNLEVAAERAEGFDLQFKHVDLPLLERQQDYFLYAIDCLQFILAEYPIRIGKKKVPHGFPWPPKQATPPLHNPPKEHVPPWLTEAQKRRHIELAEEQERSAGLHPRKPKPPKLSARQRRERAMNTSKSQRPR